jgi:DNA repair exonuclease SbcCD ATPase subunit
LRNKEFKELENININYLIKNDRNEMKKYVDLLVMYLFNCENKEVYIDRISNFDDLPQQELLRIVEKYMYIDENDRVSITRGVSNRNTLGQDFITESDFTMKYMSKIEALQKDKDTFERQTVELIQKVNELEAEIDGVNQEKNNYASKIKKLEETIQKKNFDLDELKKNNLDLTLSVKQLSDLTKDTGLVNELKAKLEVRNNEIRQLKEDMKGTEVSHSSEINRLNEEIDVLHENVSSLTEMKSKYEKMKEIYKDYDVVKDRLNYFEAVNKDYTKLKMNYMTLSEEKVGLEKVVKEYEQKLLDLNLKGSSIGFKQSSREPPVEAQPKETVKTVDKRDKSEEKALKRELEKKDGMIEDLREKIDELERQMIVLKNSPKEKETVVITETKTIRQEPTVNNVDNDKIRLLEDQMLKLKMEYEMDATKKTEEVEFYKKDNDETKDRYEKEFELMASCVYNLGLNYWSMKMEYTQKLNEKPSWLIKERQRYFNGDF